MILPLFTKGNSVYKSKKRFIVICFGKYIKDSIIKTFLIKILFFFYLSSSYLSAVHMHHACEDHSDTCKVCIMVKNFHSADIPDTHITISTLACTHDEIKLHYTSPITYICKGFYSTAPPYS